MNKVVKIKIRSYTKMPLTDTLSSG